MTAQIQIWNPALCCFQRIVSKPPIPRLRCRGVRCCSSKRRSSAVIWFKHDLRIDDHPGMDEASRNHCFIIPLYIFDYRILHRFSDELLELLLFALDNLRESLKRNGSNLMLRVGRAEDIILDLISQVNAIHLFAEEEIDHHLRELMATVEDKIANLVVRETTKVIQWRTPLFGSDEVTQITQFYDEFKKQEPNFSTPIRFNKISCVATELEWGELPSLIKLKEFIANNSVIASNRSSVPKIPSTETIPPHKRKALLTNLPQYLRRVDEDEPEISLENLFSSEICETSSIQDALTLGVISKRRLHFEARKLNKGPKYGIPWPSRNPVSELLFDLCSSEWYALLARSSVLNGAARIWTWNGFLIQYTCCGERGPAVVLVHGFGAFLNHFRDNISALSEAGNRVWAMTLIGFGRSEKPNMLYTEIKWAELVRDFVIEVVNEPVHVIGNSIGGYVAAIVAYCWPDLVKSVVLINSAGEVTSNVSDLKIIPERKKSGIGKLFGGVLLVFLRANLRSIVKRCYPMRHERADDWLIEEMLRGSCDPGGAAVMESVFSLDLSLPLNALLRDNTERVLVIQGMKDPIVDPDKRVALFEQYWSGISVKKLDAGHCPHDEIPEEVNSLISQWLITMVT